MLHLISTIYIYISILISLLISGTIPDNGIQLHIFTKEHAYDIWLSFSASACNLVGTSWHHWRTFLPPQEKSNSLWPLPTAQSLMERSSIWFSNWSKISPSHLWSLFQIYFQSRLSSGSTFWFCIQYSGYSDYNCWSSFHGRYPDGWRKLPYHGSGRTN